MLNAVILLKIVPTKTEKILKLIKKMKNVRKTYFTYGRFDIVAFLEIDDYKEMRSVTGEINSIEGVRSTETLAEA